MPRLMLSSFSPSPNRSTALRRRKNAFFSRRLRVILISGVLFGGLGLWTFLHSSPAFHARFIQTSKTFGFVVKDVRITGRYFTEKKEILDALHVKQGDALLKFDPVLAQQSLEALPWVKSAAVHRQLPHTLSIHLTERRPLALWQHQQKLSVIDDTGTLLTDNHLERYRRLPLLIGEKAPEHAKDLFLALTKTPRVWNRLSSATWVSERRWDLKLDNGIVVHLPEGNVQPPLQQLSDIDIQHNILERDITTIDLRVPDRIAVRASPQATSTARVPREKI